MAFDHTLPIPDMTLLRARQTAREYPIRLDSPENSERAVDVRMHGIAGKNYYHRPDNPPYWHSAPGSIPELYVREGVLARLVKVNEFLHSLGMELFLFDAYRPVEVQTYFHDHWVPQYLREKFPEWSEIKIREEVDNYWAKSAPSLEQVDPYAPPPHSTGGVVDLTLRTIGTDEFPFMGSDFDEVSSISFADHFERKAGSRTLTAEEELARTNRRILYAAMCAGGFVVNPNEWWHFGYGDKLSASLTNAPHAVYSVMKIDV